MIQAVSGGGGGGGGGGATDPFYAYRTLIMNMQGSAGSTTFTDESPNPVSITPYGNAQLASDATFGTVGSFDGSGDYLVTGEQFDYGANDFTVELWFNSSVLQGGYASLITRESSVSYNRITLCFSSNGQGLNFWVDSINGGGPVASYNANVNDGLWHHLAITRSGTTFTMWLDGVSVSQSSSGVAIPNDFTPLQISKDGSNRYFNGLIGPLRFSPWAVYTSNFTPSQNLFPAVQGYPQVDPYYPLSSLILNMQGTAGGTTFVDESPNAFTVTPYGNAQLVSDATYGTAASFDGSGDYLSIPSNAAFAFGTGDFTVEFWYYYTGTPQKAARIFQTRNGDLYSGISITHKFTNNNQSLAFAFSTTGSNWTYNTNESSTIAADANTWTHFAIVRSGNVLYCYKNGIQNIVFASFTGSLYYNSTDTPVVGGQAGTSRSINGLIGPLRITKGVARYTSNFTLPTGLFPTS